MGISRSASVTISYLMKERGTPLEETLSYVRSSRSIVRPNKSFFKQLQVYEGMLNAIRHRHSYGSGRMFRSKSMMVMITESKNKPTNSKQTDKDDKRGKPVSRAHTVHVVSILEVTIMFGSHSFQSKGEKIILEYS